MAHTDPGRIRKANARFAVWNRDKVLRNGRHIIPCYLCGRELSYREWTLEHVIPLSRGGSWERKNLEAACSDCNLEKADSLLHEMIEEPEPNNEVRKVDLMKPFKEMERARERRKRIKAMRKPEVLNLLKDNECKD